MPLVRTSFFLIVAVFSSSLAGAETLVVSASAGRATKQEITVIHQGSDVFIRPSDLARLGFTGPMWTRILVFARLKAGARMDAAGGEFVSLASLSPYVAFAIDGRSLTLALHDPADSDGCAGAAQILAVIAQSKAILIRSSAPVAAAVSVAPQPSEPFAAAPPMITIDLPNAVAAGLPPRVEWSSGPMESMRAAAYTSGGMCGVRLRLQPRTEAMWRAVAVANGVSVTAESVANRATEVLASQPSPSGVVSTMANLSGISDSRPQIRSDSSGFIATSFAQSLPSGGVIRGFVSEIRPATAGAPFGAIGVSAVPAGRASIDATLGDTSVNLGDTGENDLASITTSLFRGAAANLRVSPSISLQIFGGRAAGSSLIRVGTDSTYAFGTGDRIIGGQATWVALDRDLAFAAGALHTQAPAGGTRTLNFFQAGEVRRSSVLRIRLVTEESHAMDVKANGFALTLQPRVTTSSVTMDGFLRWLSPHFRPAGGEGFYAALRRSYGLASAYHRGRLSAGASFSQAKVFSILDPEDVGSLTSTRSISASYQMLKRFSLQATHNESSVHSDPGARFPADSETRETGGGFVVTTRPLQIATQLFTSSTRNDADPELGLRSRRIDVDLTSSVRDLYGRFAVADSRRPDGTSAGSDYRAAVGANLFDIHRWDFTGEAGIDVVPAGVVQNAYRQTWGTLRINPAQNPWLNGNLQFTYERVTSGAERFNIFLVAVGSEQLTRWGEQMLFAPRETRALPLVEERFTHSGTGTIHVHVFEDENQNGNFDSGEPAIAPAVIEIDGRRYRTNADGELEARVIPGTWPVRLLPQGAPIGEFIPTVKFETTVTADSISDVNFALRPAGRISGSVVPEGEIESRLLSGIVLHAAGPVERDVVTDGNGNFDFDLLPAGEYRVDITAAPLREKGLAAIGQASEYVRVMRGGRATVTFHLRRLTARERFTGGT